MAEEKSLEERARDFLKSAAVGRRDFSKVLDNTSPDIREYLLRNGYVERGSITALGRTYATYQRA